MLPRRGERPARTEWPTPDPVKRQEPVQPVQPVQSVPRKERQERPGRREPAFVEHPAEISDRWFIPEGLGDPEPPPRRAPRHEPVEPEWAPSWESHDSGGRRSRHAPATETAMSPVEPQGRPAAAYDPSTQFGMTAEQTNWLAQYNSPADEGPTYTSRAYVPPARVDPPINPEPRLTDRPSRRAFDSREHGGGHRAAEPAEEASTGRRHRADPEEPEEPQETGGGRRRRAEGAPSWQETVGRGAEPEPRSSGSHAAGRSVNELLANHGVPAADGAPRRRRRRED